jgi:hypothetical protein
VILKNNFSKNSLQKRRFPTSYPMPRILPKTMMKRKGKMPTKDRLKN